MRTHARYEAQRAAAAAVATDTGAQMSKGRATMSPTMAAELSKVTIKIENNSRNNNNFLLNHHHILNHPTDDMVSSAASVANTIIKTENTLLKIQ